MTLYEYLKENEDIIVKLIHLGVVPTQNLTFMQMYEFYLSKQGVQNNTKTYIDLSIKFNYSYRYTIGVISSLKQPI